MLTKRNQIIQHFINKNKYKNYLEIGVDRADVFFSINCRNKFAVDPKFKFNTIKKITRAVASPNRKSLLSNINAKYFETTSDLFFEKNADHEFKGKLDICFIDGMHEFDFSTRDVLNSLKYLNDNGIVILHDCNPQSKEEECSYSEWEKRGFTGGWNGDVWKTIVYLKAFHKELTAFVVDTDQGLGIVMKSKPENKNYPFNFTSQDEIRNLDYAFLEKHRNALLDLMSVSDFNRLIA